MSSKGSILLLELGKVVIQEKAARILGCDSHNRYGWRRRLISQLMEQWMVKSREDRLFEVSTVVQEVRTSPMHPLVFPWEDGTNTQSSSFLKAMLGL